MHLCNNICKYICMSLSMYVCIYIYTCVCVCVCVCEPNTLNCFTVVLDPILNTLCVMYFLTCLSSSDRTDDNKGNS